MKLKLIIIILVLHFKAQSLSVCQLTLTNLDLSVILLCFLRNNHKKYTQVGREVCIKLKSQQHSTVEAQDFGDIHICIKFDLRLSIFLRLPKTFEISHLRIGINCQERISLLGFCLHMLIFVLAKKTWSILKEKNVETSQPN